MPGAKRVQISASINDADGDPTTLTWRTPDGAVITDSAIVNRLLTAGEHIFIAEVRDNRGGLSRQRAVVSVPVWRDQRSLSFDFVSFAGRGSLGPIFPGERAGLIDSAAWNAVSPSTRDQGTSNTRMAPRAPANTKPSKDATGFWHDSDGKVVDLRISMPGEGKMLKVDDITPLNKHNPNMRLMSAGLTTPKLEISGIPFARYDVIAYVIGDVRAYPQMLGEAAAPSRRQPKARKKQKKKKKKGGKAAAGPATIAANGTSVTLPAIPTNRINGSFSEFSADNQAATW